MNKTTFCLISGWWRLWFFFFFFWLFSLNCFLFNAMLFWYKVFFFFGCYFILKLFHSFRSLLQFNSIWWNFYVYFISMKIFALVQFIFILHFSKIGITVTCFSNQIQRWKHISKFDFPSFELCIIGEKFSAEETKKKFQFFNERNLNNA